MEELEADRILEETDDEFEEDIEDDEEYEDEEE